MKKEKFDPPFSDAVVKKGADTKASGGSDLSYAIKPGNSINVVSVIAVTRKTIIRISVQKPIPRTATGLSSSERLKSLWLIRLWRIPSLSVKFAFVSRI